MVTVKEWGVQHAMQEVKSHLWLTWYVRWYHVFHGGPRNL